MKRKRDDEVLTALTTFLATSLGEELLQLLPCSSLAFLARTCSTMLGIVYQYVRSSAYELGMDQRTKESHGRLLFAMAHLLGESFEYPTPEPCRFGIVFPDTKPNGWSEDAKCYVEDNHSEVEKLIGLRVWKYLNGPLHCVVITNNGCAFTWGQNHEGQLGHGFAHAQRVPKLVSSLKPFRVANAKIGPNSTVFLTSCGRVFVTGANICNDLGTREVMGEGYRPFNYHRLTEMIHEYIKGNAVAIHRPTMYSLEVHLEKEEKEEKEEERDAKRRRK